MTVPMLSLSDYLRATGHSERTVRRCLADGRLPDAVKDERGSWWIPADARPLPAGAGTVAVYRPRQQVAPAGTPAVVPHQDRQQVAPAAAPVDTLPMLATLEDVARHLGTTVGGVRRLAADGVLVVGPWGPYRGPRVLITRR